MDITIPATEAPIYLRSLDPNQHLELVAINAVAVGPLVIEDVEQTPTAYDPDVEVTEFSVWADHDMFGMQINLGSDVTIRVVTR